MVVEASLVREALRLHVSLLHVAAVRLDALAVRVVSLRRRWKLGEGLHRG